MSPLSPPRQRSYHHLRWRGDGNSFPPTSAPQPHCVTLIPSIGLIGPPIYFLVSTSELVIMGHPPLPPPPQMSNGGSPPAPLPPSKPPEPASRRLLPFANAFAFAFASSARASPRDNSRPNLLPNENRRPPEPSSYGSAAAASLSGLITGLCLCDASNATPLLHACATSRTAAGMRQSPKSVVATKRPPNALPRRLHGLMHRQDLRSRLVPVHDLASALVGTTYLARPVLPLSCLLPPTLTYCWGGCTGYSI